VRNTLQPFAKAGAREIAAGNLQPAAYGIGHPRVPQPPFYSAARHFGGAPAMPPRRKPANPASRVPP
jgi:hypothetical protein